MSEHRASRLRKWLVDRGWAHAVLFSGSAIFLLPFLWMVATSMKTDEELSDAAWLPSIPSFAAASPYVRVAREPHRPSDAPEAVWREAIVRMDASARAAVLLGDPADAGVDRDALAAAAAAVLVDQLAAKMPRTAWSNSADAGSAFTGLLTPEAVASAIDDRLARLELKNLQLRTLDGHVIPLASEPDLVAAASVESGAGILATVGGATRLSYHFASSSDAPVVVRIPLTLPADFDPASLHKLILGLKSDDSWHRLD
ncbi:MAG: hypothetical protein H0W83_13635, partial [Planctomycetes bacterium]|nr:hypothetical protein [Planctomycetota bacterium]